MSTRIIRETSYRRLAAGAAVLLLASLCLPACSHAYGAKMQSGTEFKILVPGSVPDGAYDPVGIIAIDGSVAAFDIAGQGLADPASLLCAVTEARRCANLIA